jgi:hypothetical protein
MMLDMRSSDESGIELVMNGAAIALDASVTLVNNNSRDSEVRVIG